MAYGLGELRNAPFEKGVDRVQPRHVMGEVGPRPPAVRRQPVEPDPEDKLEEEPQPKDRDYPDDGSVQPHSHVDWLFAGRTPPNTPQDAKERRDDDRPL